MQQLATNGILQWFFNELFVPLLAFFAFPAIGYTYLKIFIGREGKPELWYLPEYGFRLVIRNIPGKKILTDIRYRAILRKIHPATSGSSVSTSQDTIVSEREEFFLFQDYDHVIVSFRLEESRPGDADFVVTDKLGQEIQRVKISDFDILICDYIATVENSLNFNIRIARRAEISASSLLTIWQEKGNFRRERNFPLDNVITIG